MTHQYDSLFAMATFQDLSRIMNNCCFYQHPNLMRALDMHTTVMDIMVNVLGGSTEAGKQISTSQVR